MSNFRVLARLLLYIAVPALVAISTFSFLRGAFLEPMDTSDEKKRLVEISAEASFEQISDMLRDDGFIRYAQALRLLARIKGIKARINPGEYLLAASMTPVEILTELTEGKVFKRKLSIAAGETVWQISKSVAAAGLLTERQFNEAAMSPALLARAGVPAHSFEGYLYPGSFAFTRPISVEKVIWSMLELGEKHWKPEFSDQAGKLKYTRHEILTLASLIQKEAPGKLDYASLSSVFHNRLNQGIKLQSEASVIYGLKDFSGRLTREDLATPSEYNTFINFGLPVGPICNPSIEAVEAALYPDTTAYLFFLNDGSQRLKFLTSQKEYEAARRKAITGDE